MSFSSRRGRPPKPKSEADSGTPELREKRALGITSEAIDLCLARGIITPDEHWCGLHLRWLYTIRYGAPSLSSYWWQVLCEQHGPRIDSPDWRAAREEEYMHARTMLQAKKLYESTMRISVYNELPCFLRPDLAHRALTNPALLERFEHERDLFKRGVEHLSTLWKRPFPS